MKIPVLVASVAFAGCILGVADAHAAQYFIAAAGGNNSNPGTSDQPWATFAYAMSAMTGGDTLIVKDGTYHETIRDIPAGTNPAYTVIKAEHDFKVTIRATDQAAIYVNSNYVRVEGIKCNGDGVYNSGMASGHHIKFLRCAFFGARSNNNSVSFTTLAGSDYVLVEDCWAWGAARYKFVAYQSDHVVFRRCVSRQDFTDDADNQSATFTNYDSLNVLYQNVIALDCGDHPELYGNDYGGIWFENNEQIVNNITVCGSIFLNLGTVAFSDPKIYGTHRFENVVAWNCDGGCEYMNVDNNWQGRTSPSLTVAHATMGHIYGIHQDATPAGGIAFSGYPGLSDFPAAITHSLIEDCNAYGLGTDIQSDYNVFFGNAANYMPGGKGAGTHDRELDPGMKYIVRIENNSPLKGAAPDGSDLGANVLYRYGVSGTLWGETGYDQQTTEPLWPYPYEDEIKADMASWTGPHDGKRGFCAPGAGLYGGPITLTSYIWEYLGNAMPADMYTGHPPDPTVTPVQNPVLNSGVMVFPNPAKDRDTIVRVVGAATNLKITICNAAGEIVCIGRFPDQASGYTSGHEAYYDYAWTGKKSNGIYFAIIRGVRGTESTVRRVKFAVTK